MTRLIVTYHVSRNAIQLISPRNTPLDFLAEVAKQMGERYVEDSIPFDTAVRRITMHVILVGLLSDFVNESAISASDIDLVTCGINELWTLSKSSTYRPDLLEAINKCLRLWLPKYADPMEIIIPTYETMWRVVAIAVALAHDNPHSLPVFTRLLQQPTHEQYQEVVDDNRCSQRRASGDAIETDSCGRSFSADNFMQEVLRLYPPTRRISRVVPISTFPILGTLFPKLFTRNLTIAADVEALQRDSIWGNSRGEFDPVRHRLQRCTEQQRETLLAFGAGKLTCIAKNWAPQAAAIITAAFLDQVGQGKDLVVQAGRTIGGREGWEGWSVQKSVKRLTVERVSGSGSLTERMKVDACKVM